MDLLRQYGLALALRRAGVSVLKANYSEDGRRGVEFDFCFGGDSLTPTPAVWDAARGAVENLPIDTDWLTVDATVAEALGLEPIPLLPEGYVMVRADDAQAFVDASLGDMPDVERIDGARERFGAALSGQQQGTGKEETP